MWGCEAAEKILRPPSRDAHRTARQWATPAVPARAVRNPMVGVVRSRQPLKPRHPRLPADECVARQIHGTPGRRHGIPAFAEITGKETFARMTDNAG